MYVYTYIHVSINTNTETYIFLHAYKSLNSYRSPQFQSKNIRFILAVSLICCTFSDSEKPTLGLFIQVSVPALSFLTSTTKISINFN